MFKIFTILTVLFIAQNSLAETPTAAIEAAAVDSGTFELFSKGFKATRTESHIFAAAITTIVGAAFIYYDDDVYPTAQHQNRAMLGHMAGIPLGIFAVESFNW